MGDPNPYISVVAPVYNEAECLPRFYERVAATLGAMGHPFEIVLVDDGSRDTSWGTIMRLNQADERVRGVRFTRNFGQHQALSAGLREARGEWVILMDCDLQDQPEEIPKFLEQARQGYQIVLARRSNRTDNAFKRGTSQLFYMVLNYIADINIDPTTANFGVYHRKVVESFNAFPEHHRFVPGMVSWTGWPKGYVDVEHGERHAGKTAYNFKRMWRLATNVILAHSDKPLRISIQAGFLMSFFSVCVILWLVVRKYLWAVPIVGWTSTMVAIFFVAGLILANMGMIGLYIGRIFEEVKNRPLYVTRETLGFEPAMEYAVGGYELRVAPQRLGGAASYAPDQLSDGLRLADAHAAEVYGQRG